MLISHSHRFVFVHVPKVAGTSMRSALEPYCEQYLKRRIGHFLGRFNFLRFPSPHLTAAAARRLVGPEVYDAYTSFCFVRNPWDWQVSLYHYIRQTPHHFQHEVVLQLTSFDDYLDWRLNHDLRLQNVFVLNQQGQLLVDRIGRLENVEADFAEIMDSVGLPNVRVPHVNKSKHKDYRSYYSDENRERVAQAFKADIEMFGYDFDGIAGEMKLPERAPR